MKRVRPNTDPWPRRLALALAVSAVAHIGPFVLARHLVPTLDLDVKLRTDVIEIGLVDPPPTPPHAPTPPPPPTPPAPLPPRPRTPPPRVADDSLPAPDVHLHAPALHVDRPHRAPHLARPTLALTHDAGAPNAPPASVAQAAGDLADLLPPVSRGGFVSLMLRTDHLRDDPNAGAVGRIVQTIPDWQRMTQGSGLDAVADLDSITMVSSNPFGVGGHAPDWFVLARGKDHSDAVLRRAVERMVQQDRGVAPSPVAPPSIDAGNVSASETEDAGSVWTERGGGEVVELERYGTRRAFVMLGDGLAAIAMPGQVERLLGAVARRGGGLQSPETPGLVMLAEIENLGAFVAQVPTQHGPFPLPTRVAVAMSSTMDTTADDPHPDGGATLTGTFQYASPQEARHALDEWNYVRGIWSYRLREMSTSFVGVLARTRGVDLVTIANTVDSIVYSVQDDQVVGHATLSAAEVGTLLAAVPVVQQFAGGGQPAR